MEQGVFRDVAAFPGNPIYEKLTERQSTLYKRDDDIRSEFARDYTRILHSLAYRRLKHKTQVFYNAAGSDHICTRIEHVAHVESVASTIGRYLGLNLELIKAIAMGHDLGHAPFGHEGEKTLSTLSEKYLKRPFWHERNGLRLVDKVELLEDNFKHYKNLDLTYAVRDGIISHCGEVDDNGIIPRKDFIDLENDFTKAGEYQPITWEGAVVKIADKIAYLGRDIEDALTLGILDRGNIKTLEEMAGDEKDGALNTGIIMHGMIIDICQNSDPSTGITLSREAQKNLVRIKKFNYEHIYNSRWLLPFVHYAELVIVELFMALSDVYDGDKTFERIHEAESYYPELMHGFGDWLARYVTLPGARISIAGFTRPECDNEKIYGGLETERIFTRAVIDYIAGMTDQYAINSYQELLRY
ncbi:MAG: HD domain-containing protein [Lachnospiraceae bacterium]|nr:HD domain-containing protein [Lachnospiraceae bacterium]